MAGTILAGPVGGVVAAPLAAVAVEAVKQIHAAGLFADEDAGAPAPDGGSP